MTRFIRHPFLILILLLFPPLLQAQEHTLEGLDVYVEEARKEWGVPGLAVGVVKDDTLVFAKGFGVRELGKPEKVDEHTLFAVASNTKAFTAALLGMLVQEGRLMWSDRVIDHMEGFRMHDPWVTREMNIVDLLTHRSGLPTFGGDHIWLGGSFGRDEILRRVRYLEPSVSFRSWFQYQNLMYLAAGQVVAAVTEESWDEALREWLLIPLGMKESCSSVRDLEGRENVAAPHVVVGGKLQSVAYDDVDCIAPAAAVNSNVVDMAKWLRLNLNGGTIDGRRIIDADVMRYMHTMHITIPVAASTEKMLGTQFSGYGLGWGMSDYKGRKLIGHGGGLTGMISRQFMVPSEKLGVVVLTNFAPNRLARAVAYRVLDAFLGGPERDWSGEYLEADRKSREARMKAEEKVSVKRIHGTQPTHPLGEYTGAYIDDFSGRAEVRLERGVLVFKYNSRLVGDAEHWHNDTFRLTWRHPIYDMPPKCFLEFHLDEKGEVKDLDVTFYHRFRFRKLDD